MIDKKQDLGIIKFRIDNEECRIPQKKTQEASTQKLLTRSKTRDKNREMGNKTWELINSELTMKNVGFRKKDARTKYPKAIELTRSKTRDKKLYRRNKTWKLINSELIMKNVGFHKKRRKKKVPKSYCREAKQDARSECLTITNRQALKDGEKCFISIAYQSINFSN